MAKEYDVAVIGAGAAGMMCAAVAAQNGKRVVIIDHAAKLAEKIRISGGGRCNFTNINTTPANFLSKNPHFAKSALSRYTPQDFLALIKKHRISFHEKHRGQLFCDNSAEQIIEMLKAECASGGVTWRMPTRVESLEQMDDGFLLATDTGDILAQAVVIATGGLSIPKIGATDFAYRIADQFELAVVETRPGLVPLTFDGPEWEAFAPLSGIALEVEVETSSGKGKTAIKGKFREDLLFTHRGLSGPAILQISSYWQPGTPIVVNLLPEVDVAVELIENKGVLKKQMGNLLSQWLPARLAERLLEVADIP
ncbi:MAG TPA: aminoacetone oxidase family FAD-binding enzyme, partial [Telluria sp.]|nr:aminoacetone oxidase family FAD-binding enzyme [Telluria sp.]